MPSCARRTNEGRIREIVYNGTNNAPVVNAAANLMANTTYTYAFSTAGTSDPDGDALTFAWKFGDNTTGTGANPSHAYAFGSYEVLLTVTDARGAVAVKTLQINAGNRLPTVSFVSPADNSTYAMGDLVQFQIQASDPDEGPLPAGRFSWQIILHHEQHIHPNPEVQGLSGSFEAAFPELIDTRYELKATARDNNGGTATTSLSILPKKANLTFASTPAGAGLVIDGTHRATPYTQGFIVGSTHSALANPTVTSGGATQNFLSWNNNGTETPDRNLSFTVPNAARTLTMAYGLPPFPQVYLRGTNNAFGLTLKMTAQGDNNWAAMADFGNTVNERFKFDINGDWTLSYGDNAPANLVADQGGADIEITQGQGTYRIELNGNTKVYSVSKVTVGGLDPVADAGPDQTLTLAASIVQLNGSGSSDPDGTITAHLWTQIAGPAAVLSSATAANPTVSIPASAGPRIYSFMLKVTDNGTPAPTWTR